jgi:hypothetical protein
MEGEVSEVIAFPSKLEVIAEKVREIDAGKTDTQIAGVFNMTTEQLQKTVLDLWRGMAYSRQHIQMLQHSIEIMDRHVNAAMRQVLSSPVQALRELAAAEQLCRALKEAQEEPGK